MSLVNLILLSSTPVAGLGLLLGIDRFEKWALGERRDDKAAAGALDVVADAQPTPQPALMTEVKPEPSHRVAA